MNPILKWILIYCILSLLVFGVWGLFTLFTIIWALPVILLIVTIWTAIRLLGIKILFVGLYLLLHKLVSILVERINDAFVHSCVRCGIRVVSARGISLPCWHILCAECVRRFTIDYIPAPSATAIHCIQYTCHKCNV